MIPKESNHSFCWVTLLTRPSYLPGAIILASTLDKHNSRFPLVVQYTSSLGGAAIKTLQDESRNSGRVLTQEVDLLLPRKDQENTSSVAERFKDTFTKLRAFELYKLGYTKAAFLDADIAAFSNPDEVAEIDLPGEDWLGATHCCVCNVDRDPWASPDWHKGNCAYTQLTDSDQVAAGITESSRPTYRLLNGGMFLFHPSEALWTRLLDYFNTTDRLKTYQFPDQDFLADFYRDKWQPLSWKYNAIKTMRYWHPKLWSDEKLVFLHYIVDKPWEREVSSDGIAGHLGRDGETHQWWRDLYNEWLDARRAGGKSEFTVNLMLEIMDKEIPFTEKVPLPQEPGKPEDVRPYP